jgi:hypothetical protein
MWDIIVIRKNNQCLGLPLGFLLPSPPFSLAICKVTWIGDQHSELNMIREGLSNLSRDASSSGAPNHLDA